MYRKISICGDITDTAMLKRSMISPTIKMITTACEVVYQYQSGMTYFVLKVFIMPYPSHRIIIPRAWLFTGKFRPGNSDCCSVKLTHFEGLFRLLHRHRSENDIPKRGRDTKRLMVIFIMMNVVVFP
ncbi:hypothetical protein D3C86_1324600 [compost metagenome]